MWATPDELIHWATPERIEEDLAVRLTRTLVGLWLLTWWAAAVQAQDGGAARTARPRPQHRLMSLGVWAGLAQHSPASLWGKTADRDFALLAVRMGWTLARSEAIALEYLIDLVPAAVVSSPPRPDWRDPCLADRPCPVRSAFAKYGTVYGFGATPLGFQIRLLPRRLVQPYVSLSAGALWFRHPVPLPEGTRFNFTVDAGGGILVGRPGGLGLMLGYKLHHLSNGGAALANPGLDGHLVYAGVLRLPR